jgi:hypothetical protein
VKPRQNRFRLANPERGGRSMKISFYEELKRKDRIEKREMMAH